MKNKLLIVAGVGIVVVAGYLWLDQPPAQGALDTFAQCLTEKGLVMYGADWCPHCQNEKKAFGSSFEFVTYVECPDSPRECLAAGIEGYPTWMFPNGKKLEGAQGTEKLSEVSGCALPDTSN